MFSAVINNCPMDLDDSLIKKFYRAKEFNESDRVLCIKYSPSGKSLCTSLSDRLKVYDSLKGEVTNIISLNAPNFTYVMENSILYSSDRNVSFLSLYDNKIISTFKSHPERINFISASTSSDIFLSSCKECVKMWDLGCKNPIYNLNIQNGIAAFSGDKFIINTHTLVNLYDTRYSSGPYETILIPYSEYNKIAITSKYFCLSSNKNHQIYNFQGNLVYSLKTEKNSFVTFSPDLNYFACSSGSFLFWTDIKSKKRVHTIREETTNFGMVEFNPGYGQFATSFFNLGLWIPQIH